MANDVLIAPGSFFIDEVSLLISELAWAIIAEYNAIVNSNKPTTSRTASKAWSNTLCAMALVHSSWNEPAQRALRRNVKLHTYKQLEQFLQQDLAGPHVRGIPTFMHQNLDWPCQAECVPVWHGQVLQTFTGRSSVVYFPTAPNFAICR